MFESHKPLPITKFNGLFDRGKDISVPIDHFKDALNLIFTEDGCETRHGTDLDTTIGSVRRYYSYQRPGEASRLLILNDIGELYDSLNLVTPILSIPAMTDFSMVTFFGRAYISPHNGVEGLNGQVVYVYDGTTIRQAGGSAPTGSLSISTSALSGFVESGTHLFAVAFETASGYITKPGPAIYGVYVAPGAFKVDIANIPTGPAGTTARRILATKIADPYSGNQEAYEFFFVPEGRIANNIDTTLTVDFFDADLQSSADYLFDQRENIPACLHLSSFKNRLVALNYDGGNSIALVSNSADPESISEIDGFIAVDPASSDSLKASIEFRSLLYFAKSNRLVAYAEDLARPPAEWSPESVDYGVGTEVFGFQKILNAEGTNTDKFIIADKAGLIVFTGIAQPIDLSWKVQEIWGRINFDAANKIQVLNLTNAKCLFVALPLDSATLPNVILFGDYSRGLDHINIRWTLWSFPWDDLCIAIEVPTSAIPHLLIGSLDGNIYNYPSTNYNDDGTAIDSYGQTAQVRMDEFGAVQHCAGIRLVVNGVGNLQLSLFNQNGASEQILLSTPLAVNASQDYSRRANFKAERMSVKFRTQFFNERFELNSLVFFLKPLWGMRPQ